MAFTRKFLSALGIEADKVDEIISAHTEVVDGLKSERDSYKANAEKLTAAQKELDGLKAEIEKNDKDPYKVKYEAIKEDFEKYKSAQTEKEHRAAVEKAYRELLKSAGVSEKRIDAIIRVTDLTDKKLSDGKFENADELTAKIKTEWADFIPTETTVGTRTATPNKTGTVGTMTKQQILEIKDKAERQKAIAENAALFGI